MMRTTRCVTMVLMMLTAGLQSGFSEEDAPMTPLMVGLFNPIQMPSEMYDVRGLRLNLLYGKCHELTGLDVGFVNHATGKEVGVGVGAINYVDAEFVGCQVGAVNVARRVGALQFGVYNGAHEVAGIQVGLINYAYLMSGLQIGLVNVIGNSDMPVFPFINFSF